MTRDDKGRFVKGHPKLGGRNAGVKQTLDVLLDDSMTDDDKCAIIQAMVRRARRGDVAAACFLFDRRYGKPAQSIDLAHTGEITHILVTYDRATNNSSPPSATPSTG